ncbi:GtrA family protein [Alicyclobacillus sp. ALC3]|uniref:GtrA family protein n=1 Tax=Alicyclobacillus sp. ALC3 TaxID=2796143 RepID=UPI002378899F|nr:GtrA family protein [Alicyclobacillus sp. ALC3]
MADGREPTEVITVDREEFPACEEGEGGLTASQMPIVMNMRHTLKRYSKFLIVGFANAVVDLVVLNALLLVAPTRSAFALFVYNTAAVLCALINSYVWNRRWTFADAASGSRRERVLFFVQAGINVAVNDLVVVWLSTYLVFSHAIPLFVSSNLSKGLAMLISSTFSYLCMRLFVFRSDRGTRP